MFHAFENLNPRQRQELRAKTTAIAIAGINGILVIGGLLLASG